MRTPSAGRFRACFRRIFLVLAVAVLALLVLAAIRIVYAFRDRTPGYHLSLHIARRAPETEAPFLRVGFGRRTINPDLSNPNRPVWLAGFAGGRAATTIHDDLWAVACVIDDGRTRLGIVSLDAIGMFNDDVIAARRLLPAGWKLDYTIICATHNHSTPDLLGLWGPRIFQTGVDRAYLRRVQESIREALGEAVSSLQPADLSLMEIPVHPAGLVADSRKPEVFDPDIRVMLFTRPDAAAVIGSVVSWADHPETPWSRNTGITADFPGVLRDSLERGIVYDGQLRMEGLGGIHLYVNGAIGGLMTTDPETAVRDPFTGEEISQPSQKKSRALGNAIAQRILKHAASERIAPAQTAAICVHARSVELPIANFNFLLAPVLGLLDRGHVRWKTLRTEAALVTIGEAAIACIPGEIYPELVNGGIERAPGGDFDVDPVEVPHLRALMPGKVKFVFGMAND
ncbi:MAG: hypothetical protein HXY20_02690 [Acidobacteria bacterium]|nr:hypothetical protein [Acidobacteriota bacterium]